MTSPFFAIISALPPVVDIVTESALMLVYDMSALTGNDLPSEVRFREIASVETSLSLKIVAKDHSSRLNCKKKKKSYS
jgi:hypothetical protein